MACADLKPLTSKELKQLSEPKRSFVRYTSKSKEIKLRTATSHHKPTIPPKNVDEFLREWRRNCPTHKDKWEYLCLIDSNRAQALFRRDVDATLLGQIITTLFHAISESPSAAQQTHTILYAISLGSRFSLAVQFLSDSEKSQLVEIFSQLQAHWDCVDSDLAFEQLKICYL